MKVFERGEEMREGLWDLGKRKDNDREEKVREVSQKERVSAYYQKEREEL